MTRSLAVSPIESKSTAAAHNAVAPDWTALQWGHDDRAFNRDCLRNAALIILTLGLYVPWAKADLRRRTWSQIRVDGQALRYTGTVWELLVPHLMAIAVLAGGVALLALGGGSTEHAALSATPKPWRFMSSVAGIYGLGLLNWRARALIMRRTGLAGTAGQFSGSAPVYAAYYLTTSMMTLLTFGAASPWRQVWLRRYLFDGAALGSHRVSFHGAAAPLLGRFAITWLAGVATYLAFMIALALLVGDKLLVAIRAHTSPLLDGNEILAIAALAAVAITIWVCLQIRYRFTVLTHAIAATRIDGRRLQLLATASDFMQHALTGTLLKVASFGLLSSIVQARELRFLARHLRLELAPRAAPGHAPSQQPDHAAG